MRKVLLIAFSIFCFLTVSAQVDNEFWFAVPNLSEHTQRAEYHLMVFTYDKSATVTISMPANSSFSPITRSISANSYNDILLTNSYATAQSDYSATINNKSSRGMLVQSTSNVSCYFQINKENGEAYTLKGKNGLGVDFCVLGQNKYWNALTTHAKKYKDAFHSIQIIATENNTTVTITPSAQSGTSCNTTSKTITMNRGEVYDLRACSKYANQHLDRTKITSNKPIAVDATDDSVNPTDADYADLVADQVVPYKKWGTEYIAISQQNSWEGVFVVAKHDNTTVNYGGVKTVTLNSNTTDFFALDTRDVIYISASDSIGVFQLTGVKTSPENYELGGTILPTIQCSGSNNVMYKRLVNTSQTYANIVTRTSAVNSFIMNGIPISASQFQTVPNTASYWSYAKIDISSIVGENELLEISSSELFHLGVVDYTVDGSRHSCTYGYFSDYGTAHEYDEYDAFCEGSIYIWKNHYLSDGTTPMSFSSEGIYKDTLTDNNGCDSICVLHLSKIPYPDNVDDATGCMVPPSTNVWSIRQKAISEVGNIDDCGTTFCGDIDGDGQIEILAPIITEDVKFSKIGIFNSQAKAKRIIDVPTCSAFINIAIAKVKISDSDYKTLIFFLAYDRYIYAYEPNGSQFWKSDQQFTSHSGEAVAIASLSLADFNHDGWTEIYIGPEIFDAATGNRLAKYNGNKGHSDRAWKASRQSYQSVVADVLGDDKLELILGNTACSVNINSRTDESQNSITAVNSVPAANMKMEDNSNIPSTDGHTLLADMDGDGKLDVVVMHIDKTNRVIYIYVWNPRTGSMICTKKITDAAEFGTPNVGDIDHDGNLELNFIIGTYSGETTDANDKIYSLKYNKSTHNLEVFWTLHHDDASGSTGLSLFDFNQDGTMEIVYRDCEHLRIINGSMIHHITGNPVAAPYDLANIPCTSGTGVEYPVIADVDADGEAEIIVVGNGSKLVIYESDLAPWAPARSVWNQFAYNITNVNEDLTIPTYLYNNAQIFTDASSTTRQPFNNFLAQTTTINTQGVPFIAAADVNVSTTATTTYENDSVKIDISFCNQGDIQVNAPYCITAYKNAYRGSVLFVDTIKTILPIGDCLSHKVGFPISNVCSDKDIISIVIAINDDGHGIAQHGNQQAECDTTNNRTSVSLPTDFRSDTTKYTPIICATELPYTFTPTGTIFPAGSTSGRTIISKNNQYGCDSIITIDLTVNPTLTGDTTATFCNGTPFIWHETSYHTGGNYPYTYTSKVSGCDSIVTLHLTQLEPTDSIEVVTICHGETHTWHGQTFSESTTTSETIPNAVGCDSVCTLKLTVLPVLTGDTTASFCNGTPFIWHGTSYPTGGDYPYTYTSKVAPYCDSIVTLHLTQLEPTDSVENVTICHGESHVWHGQTFTASTTKTVTIDNAAGCDSVCTLNLTVLPALTGDTTATFCNGTPFIWHGTSYPAGGDYPYTYTSKVAPYCDSIVTLHLTQLEPTDSIENVTLCAGGSYIWHGQTFTSSTTITETIPNAAGCDSVCTLNLTILPALTGDTSATFCSGKSFTWHGTQYSIAGHYPYTYTSKVAPYCDSIVTLHLTQLEPTDSVENVTLCAGGSHTWHGQTFTTSTTITETIPNAAGCDSVCTLNLTILPALTGDTSATFCNGTPFIWHDTPYATGGDYQYTYTSKVAPYCDSIVTLHLTKLEPTDSIEVVTICYGGSHTWHGHTYTATTTTTETIDNAVGCDSVCTLKLTVLPAITGDTNMTICDTLLPVTWRGQSVTGAGEYYHTATASSGCDSTITLHVTVETCLPPALTCDTLEATLIVPDICADDDSMYIDITYTKGLPVSYNVTFGADAVAQGFQSSYTGNVRITSSTTASISIPIPNDPTNRQVYPKPNVYSIDISILDTCDAYTTWRSQNFLIHYPSWLTLQRWNDVISLYNERYNGGYVFSQIRWFHEGTLLESRGDHDGYIYQRPTLVYGDAYWAELTRADDGVTITTCPIYPVPMTDSTKMDDVTDPYIIVTPTVVTPSNPTVTVKTNICGEFYVYYVDGHLLDKQNFCPKDNHTFTIDIDPCYVRTGLYILVFYGEEGTIKAVKLLVEPS